MIVAINGNTRFEFIITNACKTSRAMVYHAYHNGQRFASIWSRTEFAASMRRLKAYGWKFQFEAEKPQLVETIVHRHPAGNDSGPRIEKTEVFRYGAKLVNVNFWYEKGKLVAVR